MYHPPQGVYETCLTETRQQMSLGLVSTKQLQQLWLMSCLLMVYWGRMDQDCAIHSHRTHPCCHPRSSSWYVESTHSEEKRRTCEKNDQLCTNSAGFEDSFNGLTELLLLTVYIEVLAGWMSSVCNGCVVQRLYGLSLSASLWWDTFKSCPTAVSLTKLLGEGSRALTSLPVGAPHKHSIVCENVHGLGGLCTSGSCY